MSRDIPSLGVFTALGLIAARVIPACWAEGPQAGIPSVAMTLGKLITWQLPAFVALIAWPLLASERFRRRAPFVALLLLAMHVLAAWLIEPFAQLLQARSLMAALGSDEWIKDLVPATWTLSDLVARLESVPPDSIKSVFRQRLASSAWVLIAVLPLLARRESRTPLLAPLAVLMGHVLPPPVWAGLSLAPWPIAAAALAHALPSGRSPWVPNGAWPRGIAGLAACFLAYVVVAGPWTWRRAFEASAVTRTGERMTATLRRFDGAIERIGFGGGPVLLLTWSSSCPGSPQGLVQAAALRRRAGFDRLRVLGLVLGGRADAEAFGLDRVPEEIVTVIDPGGTLPIDHGAGTPGWYLFDGDGTLFQQVPTEHLRDFHQMERAIEVLAGRR